MKPVVDSPRQFGADTGRPGEVLDPGFFHRLQATKIPEQGLPAFFPDPLDILQGRIGHFPGAPGPVPGNRKPVRLVPDLLNQVQGGR